jgi:hypothetical protein
MINIHELQAILSNNGGKILDNISTRELEQYRTIKNSLATVNVAEDEAIQEEISAMNKFGRKRIAKKMRKQFYEVLEEKKDESELNILEICRMLFADRPKKRFRSKHFSIATRMMHLIHENYPVYNNNVASLFDYTPPRGDKIPLFRKLNDYIEFYDYMIGIHREILVKGELYDLLKVVEIKNKAYKDVLNQAKCLDLVMRSASQLQKKGLLILPQKVVFSNSSGY